MHVLIATDGTLDPETAAHFAASLAGPGGAVTVVTVVEINRKTRLVGDANSASASSLR